MALQIKRAYEKPSQGDGLRILVDRVWPRGLTKEALKLHEWQKELAPSTPLRKWFNHDPKKWPEFRKKYRQELTEQKTALNSIRALARKERVTLVYSAKDKEHNQAVVLLELLSR